MSRGATDIDIVTNPLLSSIGFDTSVTPTWTYAFAEAGEAVDKGGFTGGSDFTSAWTEAEKAEFRLVAARYMEVANVTLTEVATTAVSSVDLQMVESVPGGAGGYAGGSTFVVGSAGRYLLTHELGHTLYLSHPFEAGSTTLLPGVTTSETPGDFGFNSRVFTVEAYTYGEPFQQYDAYEFTLTVNSLGALDIAALQAMYGANETFADGDTTYGLNDVFETIWDGGGNDTIDFSASTQSGVIDLRAATLQVEEGGLGRPSLARMESTPFEDHGGYNIAFGVVIENGLAGSGDDTLHGNAADNLLHGGLGDDTFFGGDGNDTLIGSEASEIATIKMVDLNSGSATNRSLSIDDFDDMPGSMTMDLILRLESGTTHDQRIISYDPDNSSDPHFDLQLFSSGYLFLILTDPGAGLIAQYTGIDADDLLDDEVHRLTVSRDGATGTWRFFLDGDFKRELETTEDTPLTAGGSLAFGQSQGRWGSANDPDYAMIGDLGAVAVYDTVLSDAEVAQRSLADLADPSDPSLVSYWVPDASNTSISDALAGDPLDANNVSTILTHVLNSDDDVLNGEAGDDELRGNLGNDVLKGGTGNDRVEGEVGDDLIAGNAGEDTLLGGEGEDRIFGGSGDDTISGGDGADDAEGGSGNDKLYGNDGNDSLEGGDGADTMSGGNGSDRLLGRDGDDSLVGGNDNDTIAGGNDDDIALGGSGDDLIYGNNGADTLDGGSGADELSGGNDNDIVNGGSGADTLRGANQNDQLTGGTGNDLMAGNTGDDTLEGGAGDDRMFGGSGNDTLLGGDGLDVLGGDQGADTFVFADASDSAHGSSRDTITDFTHDTDFIDLSGIMSGLTFVGAGGYGGNAGEVRYNDSIGRLYVDLDGDGASDLSINVTGAPTIDLGDLILV